MKTLDEVITIFEKACDLDQRCEGCSGCLAHDEGCPNDGANAVPDALHYLKEYKERQEMLRYWSEKAISEQQNIADAYMFYKIASEKEKDNLPLTWEELKSMEGKPVWTVESTCTYDDNGIERIGRWNIIREVTQEHIIFYIGLPYHKSWQGIGWQAYRKERE